MEKFKKNNPPAKNNTQLFFKAMLLTAICIALIVIGFVSAGYFFGAIR